MSNAIEVQGLYKSFKDKALAGSLRSQLKFENIFRKKAEPKTVLSDINFKIKHGESVGLIGSNGSGKSTLLKCLSRILWPSAGTININGTLSPMLEVGTGFYPDLSGRENVFLAGSLLGMSKVSIEHAFDEIVDFAELREYIDHPVRFYSSGMYVRLGFAVASLLASDIMVIDEVLAVGDNHFKKKCTAYLTSKFLSQGRTLLVVSHDMHLVNSVCQRCLVVDQGRLIYDGPTEQAIKLHLNTDTKDEAIDLVTDNFAIRQFKVESEDISLTGKHRAGEKLLLNINIEVFKKLPDLIFEITFRHKLQGIISTVNNLTESTSLFLDEGKHVVLCEISNIPLNAGEYFLDLEIQHKHHLLATKSGIASIHIEGGTFFKSGRLPKASQGLALINTVWSQSK